jgi:hypothetical protein
MIIHIPYRFQISEGYSLPKSHQMLCQMIYQLALRNNERACIAGSHALQQVMSELGRTSFKSNDVDIFTSLYFDDENIKILEHKFQQLCSDHLVMTNKLLESRSGVDGMRQIWNIEIFGLQRTGNVSAVRSIYPPLQVIVLNNELPIELRPDDHGFAVSVVERFDISVCKCVIPNLFRLDQVVAMSRSDIINWEMEYDMRKFKRTKLAWKRIVKYADRGFKLCRLRFEDNNVIRMVDGTVDIVTRRNRSLTNDTMIHPLYGLIPNIDDVSISTDELSEDYETAF